MTSRPRTTADEIHQTRPFASLGQEAIVALLLTADRVRSSIARSIAERGDLTFQQYNVLRILKGGGKDGVATLEIADRMVERTPGITRLIDRLVRGGLVRRQRGKDDRRRVHCHLTARGRATLARVDPAVEAADGVLDETLSETELRRFTRTLDRVRARYP